MKSKTAMYLACGRSEYQWVGHSYNTLTDDPDYTCACQGKRKLKEHFRLRWIYWGWKVCSNCNAQLFPWKMWEGKRQVQ